jgi:membrane protease YdiL (CAAX protease family)
MSANDPLPEYGDNKGPFISGIPDAVPADPAEHQGPSTATSDARFTDLIPAPVAHARASGLEERVPPRQRPQPLYMAFLWAIAYFWTAFFLCLAFLLVTQVVPGVGVVVVVLVKHAWQNTMGSVTPEALTREMLMPALALAQVAGILVSCLALRLVAGRHWVRKVAFRRPGWFHLLLTVLVVPALVIVSNGLYALAKKVLPPLPGIDMEKFVGDLPSWPLWLGVLVVGLGPGLSEELWCRAFLGRGLAGRNGVVARLLISSIFFGLIHIDPRQGSMAAVMGMVLYFVYVTTRSLWMPMLVHFLNNSTSVVASHFENNKIDQNPEEIPALIFAAAAFLMVTLLVALYKTRARLVREEGLGPPTWEPLCTGIDLPPPGSGTRVVQPRPTLAVVGLVVAGVLAFAGALAYAT